MNSSGNGDDLSAKGDEGVASWQLRTSFLSYLSPKSRKKVLGLMETVRFEPGEVLVEEGAPSDETDGLHLIVQGTVLVKTARGAEARLGPGQVMGERSVIRNQPAMATVSAETPVVTALLPREEFLKLYRGSKGFREYIAGLIRLREQWEQLVQLVSRNKMLRLLGKEETKRLLESGRVKLFDAGEKVLQADDAGSKVVLIVKGSLVVQTPSKEGSATTRIALKKRGDLAGEAAAVLERPQPADVVSVEKTELLVFDRRAFMDVVTRSPWVWNQLQKEMLVDGGGQFPDDVSKTSRFLTFVHGTERGIGATTIAYGLAGALRRSTDFDEKTDAILVDLDGDESARMLGLKPSTSDMHGLKVKRVGPSEDWNLEVVWPLRVNDTQALLTRLESTGRPVIATGRPGRKPSQDALDMAGAVVFVRRAGRNLHEMMVRHHQISVQAIRVVPGVAQPLSTSRKAVRFLDDTETAQRFWNTASLDALTSSGGPLGRACCRLARVLRGSSVGVALGGGGAFGFAHVGLLRVLKEAGIPIDFVAGVSFGSLVGAMYVGGGMQAVEKLVNDQDELMRLVADAMTDTSGFQKYVDRACRTSLEVTEIPFYPVGYDLVEEREFVLAEGSLGLAVLSASSMPGSWPTLESVPGHRIVDGGVVNNVPVSTIWDAGADYILGSSIIPARSGFSAKMPFDRLKQKLPELVKPVVDSAMPDCFPGGILRPVNDLIFGRIAEAVAQAAAQAATDSGRFEAMTRRINDLVKSLYLLMGQNGRDRSLRADYVFEFEAEGFDVYDFFRGDKIAIEGQKNVMVQEIEDSYKQDTSRRF